jgi:hypothetical protein
LGNPVECGDAKSEVIRFSWLSTLVRIGLQQIKNWNLTIKSGYSCGGYSNITTLPNLVICILDNYT